MAIFQLFVNGHSRTVSADADMPLLWVLRDALQLRGTKFGCGRGMCGACTVLLDNAATRSCVTPVHSIGQRAIVTIEGLSAARSGDTPADSRSTPALHPVQRAWIDEDVPQCGYCQAGQIMTAVALLASRPKPTPDEITEAMSNNLCRCGTYVRIRRAVRRAADLMNQESR